MITHHDTVSVVPCGYLNDRPAQEIIKYEEIGTGSLPFWVLRLLCSDLLILWATRSAVSFTRKQNFISSRRNLISVLEICCTLLWLQKRPRVTIMKPFAMFLRGIGNNIFFCYCLTQIVFDGLVNPVLALVFDFAVTTNLYANETNHNAVLVCKRFDSGCKPEKAPKRRQW